MKLRLALRETLHNWRFSSVFVVNLALGLFGFVFLSGFQGAIQNAFQERSQMLLTADLRLSARRELTGEEEEAVKSALAGFAFTESRARETYSMLAKKDGGASRLVEVQAIEPNYPLYGSLSLSPEGTPEAIDPFRVWIAPDLAIQMNLKPGDSVRIGDAEFTVTKIVEDDSSLSWRGASLAPRVYVGLDSFLRTNLIQKGSRVSFQRFYKVPGADVEALAASLNTVLKDPELRVRTHKESGEQTGRVMDYLGDFLGLVALVGIFLSSLGGAYLFQSFIARRIGEIATLRSLGLSAGGTILVYWLQLTILSALAVSLAFLVASLTLPLASRALEEYLAFDIAARVDVLQFLPLLAIAILGNTLVCLPLLLRLKDLRPALLFQESHEPKLETRSSSLAALLPAALFFYGMSVWQAHSWRIGSFFFFGMLASATLLALSAFSALNFPYLKNRVAFRYLARSRWSTVSAFLAVGLGALLMNLLPQIQRNIQSEIEHPETSSLPSLFLFDVQEEQVDGLRTLLEREKVPLSDLSPMVRARLDSVNGERFAKADPNDTPDTREEEQSARTRNRGYNLTYRAHLSAPESLFAGRPFSPTLSPDGVAEVSVEHRFADRLGLKLGDELVFDVQGVSVTGRVTSLRKVKWTSFQPNFFIVFQPGVLDGAPKTFLGTVQRLGREERVRVQNLIVEKFPNISIIDITALADKILRVFGQMAIALRLMAALSAFTGLVVLFSIAAHQAETRRAEVQLLKVMGANRNRVARMFWIEFGSIGLAASLLGVLASTALSYVISQVFFDAAWSFSIWVPVATVLSITAVTLLTVQLAVRRTLREKPARLLAEM